ncbi:hypothetical protein [Afifella aestuarii]|uniref:hypothetical protein n=1 Tax=Afifella aestuarii TaxID=1909496 RepID=UPI000FE42E49|nr:hypothetical protein [Afifella aestuarii]
MYIIRIIKRILLYILFFILFDWIYRKGAEGEFPNYLVVVGAFVGLLVIIILGFGVACALGRREGKNWQSSVARLGEDGAARRSRLAGEWVVAISMFGALPFAYVLGSAFPDSIMGPFVVKMASYLLMMLVVFVPFVRAMDRKRNRLRTNKML